MERRGVATTLLDPATWTRSRARVVSLLVLGGVALLTLGALLAWTLAPGAGATLAWILLVPVVVLLAAEVVVLVRAPRAPSAPVAEGARASAQPAAPDLYREEAPILRETLLRLRCGNCGTIFEVPDTGERPLRHTCPGCGSEGVVA